MIKEYQPKNINTVYVLKIKRPDIDDIGSYIKMLKDFGVENPGIYIDKDTFRVYNVVSHEDNNWSAKENDYVVKDNDNYFTTYNDQEFNIYYKEISND
jgi:hypothetical protein